MPKVVSGVIQAQPVKTFEYDEWFLRQHFKEDVIVLSAPDNPNATVVLGKLGGGSVFTSTADGQRSYGWLGYEQIKDYVAGKRNRQFHACGGENRCWQGSEGTQFSLFFPKPDDPADTSFSFEKWRTPPHMHIEPAELVSVDNENGTAVFRQQVRNLENRVGTIFDYDLKRTIRVLRRERVEAALGIELPENVKVVAHESEDKMTNVGTEQWSREKGVPVDWMLGQFDPSPEVTVVAPIKQGPESKLGPKVTVIMGEETPSGLVIPPEYLVVGEKAIFSSGNGGFRAKIGIPPERSKGIIASYDAAKRILTIVQYTKHEGLTKDDFVNSEWRVTNTPYKGEDVFTYNDGPLENGSQLGPFFELESMAPVKESKPGQSTEHVHRTIHIEGSEADLDRIAKAVLGVGIDKIKTALKPKPTASELPELKTVQ